MNYKLIKTLNKGIFLLAFMLIAFISCIDNGYEEFVPPTGNVNNIQPKTLFTTSTVPNNNLGVAFRSFSTDAASYLWDFGNGETSTEANPEHIYSEGGLYTVTLTTVSSDGLEATASLDVAPIFVDFSFTTLDSQVTFTNTTSGASSLVWEFGDTETAEWVDADTQTDPDFSPIHTYKTAETFDVVLTATTFLGKEVVVKKQVDGLVLAAIPDFTFDSDGLVAQFTDNSLLAETHTWDFGDGTTSTEQNPEHTFPAEGTYDVSLTITNIAGNPRTIVKPVPIGGVKAKFKAIVLNGTGDDFQGNTGDNADAWDMTPNSTVVDDNLGTIDSPYRALWRNMALNSYIDATYCTSEQPGSTSDGNYVNGSKTRGLKISNSCRRLYQLVAVEPGVEYTFTIQSRSESEGVNSEVFILNNEITTEDAINTEAQREINTDAYYLIDNDFNKDKSSSSVDNFTTTTFTFKATANIVVIYVRALNAINSSNEVFYDNIDIITPGF